MLVLLRCFFTCPTEMVKAMLLGLSGNACPWSKMCSLYQNNAEEIRYYLGKSNYSHTPCDDNTQSKLVIKKTAKSTKEEKTEIKFVPYRRELENRYSRSLKAIKGHCLTLKRSQIHRIHVIRDNWIVVSFLHCHSSPSSNTLWMAISRTPEWWRHRSVTWPDPINVLFSRHVKLKPLALPKVLSHSFHSFKRY